MTNKQIADIFARIADILEIKGDNVFRVRAYRVASQKIMGLGRELADICKGTDSHLEEIPGIGKDLAGKIGEMVSTGKLAYFNELAAEFPPGFLGLMDISGLGPKKLKKLRDELGIKNVDDLEKVCRENKLASLDGMGSKTQENLLEAIEHFRKKQGRMLLPEAYDLAEEITGYLKASRAFIKLEKTGSLRRGKETVGDIDILAVAKDPSVAMNIFISYPEVKSVIAKGKTKTSVILSNGAQVDLRVVDNECFGAALVYFTGSQQHNVKIRNIAKARSLKISEYGVFSVDKRTGRENKIAGKTEKDVYSSIGMEWIPPELREVRGEIEAALDRNIPKDLIQLAHIKGDLHLHTDQTDGRASVEDIISSARRKGYEYIAITDHSQYVKIANGMDEKRLMEHMDNVRKIAARTRGIKVLFGAEVDILESGRLDYKDSVLRELDIVIAAVHSYFSLPREKQTKRILTALDNRFVNILAHPSGRLISRRTPLDLDMDAIFNRAADNGVFLEINTHGDRIDLNDTNCMRAKELGVRFVIDTDAHESGQMELMKYGVITARRGWLRKKDVLNTYRYEKVMKELVKR